MFRIACELYDDIIPELLQEALDQTVDDFPLYKSVLRRGLFWYYLERSDIKPEVHIEAATVCAPIYVGLRYHLLFRISYYRKRINLEVFHALSDGTGALRFLQSLVYRYLLLKERENFENTVLINDGSSVSAKMDDSFGRHFTGSGQKGQMNRKETKAYHIPGTRLSDNRMNVIEGAMSGRAVLDEAHKNKTTLTAYLTSLYMLAIRKEMRAGAEKYPVVLTVPVNLRQYYESATARNFFSYINIGYSFDSETENLQNVIQRVSAQFKEDLTQEQLNYRSNSYMSVEKNMFARIVPLPVKDLVARVIVYKARWQTTSTISNIGVISMPAEYRRFIRQFSVCTSASRPQMTLCSYGDRLVVSVTSPYRETDIQRTFFQMLSKLGIDIEISSSI